MKLVDHYYSERDFIDLVSSTDAIFHYTRRAIAVEKILPENRFKFSHFRNSTDPYEYKSKLTGAVGWGWDKPTESKIRETMTILLKIS